MQTIKAISAGSARTIGQTNYYVDLYIDISEGSPILHKMSTREAVTLSEQLMRAAERCHNGNADLDENLLNKEDRYEQAEQNQTR